ncbi:hypothetical protein C8R44DRAFT_732115 [Mycena epipterygia]|nr:hypothetical protein C8R44DRAFT_732115 [Mycena epipterygia]
MLSHGFGLREGNGSCGALCIWCDVLSGHASGIMKAAIAINQVAASKGLVVSSVDLSAIMCTMIMGPHWVFEGRALAALTLCQAFIPNIHNFTVLPPTEPTCSAMNTTREVSKFDVVFLAVWRVPSAESIQGCDMGSQLVAQPAQGFRALLLTAGASCNIVGMGSDWDAGGAHGMGVGRHSGGSLNALRKPYGSYAGVGEGFCVGAVVGVQVVSADWTEAGFRTSYCLNLPVCKV